MNNIEICPVCQIKKVDGVFYYSHNNTEAAACNVSSLICKYAKTSGCINTYNGKAVGETWDDRLRRFNLLDLAAQKEINNDRT